MDKQNMSINARISAIQRNLKAPKNQYNAFGKYKYRSCEDIVQAITQILGDEEFISLNDSIELIGDRYYIKSTAVFHFKDQKVEVSAYAREPENKKGMDSAQITGATSSYARKYALNGLFAIDDTKDSDFTNTKDKTKDVSIKNNNSEVKQNTLTPKQIKRLFTIAKTNEFSNEDVKKILEVKYKIASTSKLSKANYDELCTGIEKKTKDDLFCEWGIK